VRAEASLSGDDDLLDDDADYEQSPKQIYTSQVRVSHVRGLVMTGEYAYLDNDQDLDLGESSFEVGIPSRLKLNWRLKYKHRQTSPDTDYVYAGVERDFGSAIYAYVRYRHTMFDGSYAGDQYAGYLTWTPGLVHRLEFTVVTSDIEGSGRTWLGAASVARFLRPESTSLRFQALHYDTDEGLDSQEYLCHVYQRVGDRSFLRFGARYFRDSDQMESYSLGVKAKRFFSPRFSAHIGYRWYDHRHGPDLSTVLLGMSALF
jgi:hypothetical protein